MEKLDRPTRVGFVSLGCPKNLVDSEVMMGLLARSGAELTRRAEDADVIVVNTCSFIDSGSGMPGREISRSDPERHPRG
jgi:ribosomal protein S12 methylthiotransferase